MGLYGNIVVAPTRDPAYWPPVHREVVVTLDDVFIEDGQIVAFQPGRPDLRGDGAIRQCDADRRRGRAWSWRAQAGEVVRLYFTNTANTRLFDVAVTGGAHEAGRERQRTL